jgi:hypothetical protein
MPTYQSGVRSAESTEWTLEKYRAGDAGPFGPAHRRYRRALPVSTFEFYIELSAKNLRLQKGLGIDVGVLHDQYPMVAGCMYDSHLLRARMREQETPGSRSSSYRSLGRLGDTGTEANGGRSTPLGFEKR